MVTKREKYELTGYDSALAYSNLRKIVSFNDHKTLDLPGPNGRKFLYFDGYLKNNPNIRVTVFQRENKGRVVLRYDDEKVHLVELEVLRTGIRRQKSRQDFSFKRARDMLIAVDGMKIETYLSSIFSENQLLFR